MIGLIRFNLFNYYKKKAVYKSLLEERLDKGVYNV